MECKSILFYTSHALPFSLRNFKSFVQCVAFPPLSCIQPLKISIIPDPFCLNWQLWQPSNAIIVVTFQDMKSQIHAKVSMEKASLAMMSYLTDAQPSQAPYHSLIMMMIRRRRTNMVMLMMSQLQRRSSTETAPAALAATRAVH